MLDCIYLIKDLNTNTYTDIKGSSVVLGKNIHPRHLRRTGTTKYMISPEYNPFRNFKDINYKYPYSHIGIVSHMGSNFNDFSHGFDITITKILTIDELIDNHNKYQHTNYINCFMLQFRMKKSRRCIEIVKVLKTDGLYLQYVEDKLIEYQFIAVRQNGNALQYIDNPSFDVQLTALSQSIDSFKYIKNPSKEIEVFIARI